MKIAFHRDSTACHHADHANGRSVPSPNGGTGGRSSGSCRDHRDNSSKYSRNERDNNSALRRTSSAFRSFGHAPRVRTRIRSATGVRSTPWSWHALISSMAVIFRMSPHQTGQGGQCLELASFRRDRSRYALKQGP